MVRLLTLSHTCYFQLRHPSSEPRTPVNMTALSRALSLDSPGRPLTQEYECISPNPCPTFPAPSSPESKPWPRKTQTPEIELLLVPKRMTLAKAFFLSLSNRWNIPEGEEEHSAFEIVSPTTVGLPSSPRAIFSPVMRLQLMKVWVSLQGSDTQSTTGTSHPCQSDPKSTAAPTESVSSLEYLRLNLIQHKGTTEE